MKKWKVCVRVTGLNLSRMIRRAGECGLRLTGMCQMDARTLILRICEDDLPQLQDLAEKGGWELTFIRREGAGHVRDLMVKRWCLTAGLLLIFVLASVGTKVMWAVDVIDAGVYTQDIRQYLTDAGVTAPMLRTRVDPAGIQQALEWRYPAVSWFECGWRGMRLVIRAVEGALPGDRTLACPCDVIASRDGVVQQIVTRAGTPVVRPGDLVRKGDVLIRGVERTSDGGERSVAARGTVLARVWISAAVRTSLTVTDTVYTGRTATTAYLTSPWFRLWQPDAAAFDREDVHTEITWLSTYLLPVCMVRETHMEAEMTDVPADLDLLKTQGAEAAMRKLSKIAGGEDSIVDNWVNWSIIEDEILLSEAVGEMLTDIAQQYPTGMTAPE